MNLQRRKNTDKSHIQLTYVTHFYFNQKNADVIMNLLHRYEQYPSDLLDVIQFVIVDDASPIKYQIPNFNLNLLWLRITDEIPWNQGGARNLGIVYAKSDKVLVVGVEHEFPEKSLRHLIGRLNPGRSFYKIYRKQMSSNGAIKPGYLFNTFFLSRARFLRIYGYDEEFSGAYGGEDTFFTRMRRLHGNYEKHIPKRYYCFESIDLDRQNSYHSLIRDTTRNGLMYKQKRKILSTYGPESGHSRTFLNFNWEVVLDKTKDVELIKKKKIFWKPLYPVRQLFGYD